MLRSCSSFHPNRSPSVPWAPAAKRTRFVIKVPVLITVASAETFFIAPVLIRSFQFKGTRREILKRVALTSSDRKYSLRGGKSWPAVYSSSGGPKLEKDQINSIKTKARKNKNKETTAIHSYNLCIYRENINAMSQISQNQKMIYKISNNVEKKIRTQVKRNKTNDELKVLKSARAIQ